MFMRVVSRYGVLIGFNFGLRCDPPSVSNIGLRGEQGDASSPSVDEPYYFPEIDMSHRRIYF